MTRRSTQQCDRIRSVIEEIPRGSVATYGQIAELAGLPGHARLVGHALRELPEESGVPWHRVLNAAGGISARSEPGWEREQRRLLEEEGVEFDGRGRVPLDTYRWNP